MPIVLPIPSQTDLLKLSTQHQSALKRQSQTAALGLTRRRDSLDRGRMSDIAPCRRYRSRSATARHECSCLRHPELQISAPAHTKHQGWNVDNGVLGDAARVMREGDEEGKCAGRRRMDAPPQSYSGIPSREIFPFGDSRAMSKNGFSSNVSRPIRSSTRVSSASFGLQNGYLSCGGMQARGIGTTGPGGTHGGAGGGSGCIDPLTEPLSPPCEVWALSFR